MWLIRECIDQSLPLFAAVLAVSNFIMCLIVAVHYFLLRNAKCSFFDHLNVITSFSFNDPSLFC